MFLPEPTTAFLVIIANCDLLGLLPLWIRYPVIAIWGITVVIALLDKQSKREKQNLLCTAAVMMNVVPIMGFVLYYLLIIKPNRFARLRELQPPDKHHNNHRFLWFWLLIISCFGLALIGIVLFFILQGFA